MVDKLSSFLLNDIENDEKLKECYQKLLVDYANSLLHMGTYEFDENYQILLRYADILSLSEDESHQNLAQQIVILMTNIFPDENVVSIFKESVYKNVSNFASIELLKKNDLLTNSESEFLRNLEYETHRIVNGIPQSDSSFFDTQKTVLSQLNTNQYYSFSAPTSMGKTFVIMNFIREKLRGNVRGNFVIIVPTRALLSEIANKLIGDLKDFLGTDCHKVITTAASIVDNEKYIAVLTPERLYYALLKNPNMNFNYLFIDEAHKISDKDKRSITYYKILDMLKSKSDVNIYFSSPIIPNPDIYLELTNFYAGESRSAMGQVFRFSPVVQNKVYLDFINQQVSITNNLSANRIICNSMPVNISNKFQALISLGINKCNLVYVSSANKAISYAIELSAMISNDTLEIDLELEEVAKMIETRIHRDYFLAKLIRKKVAYHIGALPAEIRSKIEYLLRKGLIKYCFCTSTLLEGVNVPVDNLFIFDNKKGRSAMSTIDAFNLIGRAGRVTLNEYGNVFVIIEEQRIIKYFDDVLLQPLPEQSLLPKKALEKKHKKYIVERLLSGKTNLLESSEKYVDHGFTEITYEYATKCLNMLLHDLCTNNDSYIVRDFRKEGVLSPQNIINIRNYFSDTVHADDDINISANQKQKLYAYVKGKDINYPSTLDYATCLSFLKELYNIFDWEIYEKETLGKGNKLNYYAVLLIRWMEGKGLHEIIRYSIEYYKTHNKQLVSYEPSYHMENYNGSPKHKNQIINETMTDIEQIINYKFSMYFLRFSEAIISIHGESKLQNDWYEYVEYGTNNQVIIELQKFGFLREQALTMIKDPYSKYIEKTDRSIRINKQIFEVADADLLESLNIISINYPELFIG